MSTIGVLPRPAKNPLTKALLPQALPISHPRLVRELAFIEDEQGLIVDGGHGLQVLKGKSVRGILPRLLPLLDGTRSIEEVEALLSAFPGEHVRETVKILLDAGMIEDGRSHSEVANRHPDSLAFFCRHIGAMRRNPSGNHAAEKLENSEVLICVSGIAEDYADVLQASLAAMGVGRVRRIQGSPRQWTFSHESPGGRRILVALALGDENLEWNSAVDDFAAELQLPWLRVALDVSAGTADLGPIFKRSQNGCYKCFSALQLAHPQRLQAPTTMDQAGRLLWAGFTATEIVYWLSDIAPVALKSEFYRYDLNRWTCRELRWARLPGCRSCYPRHIEQDCSAGSEPQHGIQTATAFEEYIALQPLAPSGYKAGKSKPKVASAVWQSKRFAHCLQIGLTRELPKLDVGALDVLQSLNRLECPVLSKGLLGALLTATAGIREPRSGTKQIKRWAASGGNLGSVELYVAVRNVEGLSPGVYFYQSGEQSLARFQRRDQAISVDEFIQRASPDMPSSGVDAVVLFSGAFRRVSRKYGSFAYKLANLDAGVAASQLRFVASTVGLASKTLCRWADDLIEHQLNIHPAEEVVTAAVALSCSSLTSSRTSEALRLPSAFHSPAEFQGLSLADVTQQLIQESRLLEENIASVLPWEGSPRLARNEGGPSFTLPPPGRGGRAVSDILGRRISTRRFSSEPVIVQHLSGMLAIAHNGDRQDWPCEDALGETIGITVLANRIQGLPPGVYRYDGAGHRLLAEGPSISPEINRQLFTQPEFASAPAVLWITGNLKEAYDRMGSFGHRQLLLRAGAAANRAWMASIALGLSGCLVAGLVPTAARQFLGFDGYKEVSLLALAIGYSQQSLK